LLRLINLPISQGTGIFLSGFGENERSRLTGRNVAACDVAFAGGSMHLAHVISRILVSQFVLTWQIRSVINALTKFGLWSIAR
jgi:hypothetical protein